LNDLGYSLKRVLKTKAVKKIPETEAIFEQVEKINKEADESPNTLRISLDAKVGVKIGEFDRGGKTRTPTMALDHDFSPEATLIPYGIFLLVSGIIRGDSTVMFSMVTLDNKPKES
jgi:hypothetical protein